MTRTTPEEKESQRENDAAAIHPLDIREHDDCVQSEVGIPSRYVLRVRLSSSDVKVTT